MVRLDTTYDVLSLRRGRENGFATIDPHQISTVSIACSFYGKIVPNLTHSFRPPTMHVRMGRCRPNWCVWTSCAIDENLHWHRGNCRCAQHRRGEVCVDGSERRSVDRGISHQGDVAWHGRRPAGESGS